MNAKTLRILFGSFALVALTAVIPAAEVPASRPQLSQNAPKSSAKIEKIGLIFARLSSWGIGRWPSGLVTLEDTEKELLAELKRKSSGSDNKSEIIKVKDLEEARTKDIKIAYVIDYHEEAGEFQTTDLAVGTSTDIFCSFKRADQTGIATNWDNLKIAKFGKDLDLKVEKKPGLNVSFTFRGLYGEAALRQALFRMTFVFDTADAVPVLKVSDGPAGQQ